MFLVIGPHRSGTSITTKIIQEHLGPFPFEVTRHAEPNELVNIHTEFLERNDYSFMDRLYFPKLEPDFKLLGDLMGFFGNWKKEKCVVKEPMLTITMNWLPLHKMFPTILVGRNEAEMAESLVNRKKFSKEYSYKSAKWYYNEFYKLNLNCNSKLRVSFVANENLMRSQFSRVVEELGLEWQDDIFNKLWNEEEIASYRKKK